MALNLYQGILKILFVLVVWPTLGHHHFIPKATGSSNVGIDAKNKKASVPHCPIILEDARRLVGEYVEYYNNVRLHSAIGYVAPIIELALMSDN